MDRITKYRGRPRKHQAKKFNLTGRTAVHLVSTCHPTDDENDEEFVILTIVEDIPFALKLYPHEYYITVVHIKGK